MIEMFSKLLGLARPVPADQRGRLYISGTGRAGTTFLVELFGALGMETGYEQDAKLTHEGRRYFSKARAGLEWDIFDPEAPKIVKSPYLCDHVDDVISRGLVIEHVIIPIREIRSAAESRRAVQLIAGHGDSQSAVAGGLWDSVSPEHQETVLQAKFFRLIESLVRHDIPITFLNFPRFATDESYCYRKLKPFLNASSRRRFSEAFRRTSQPKLITRFPDAKHPED